MEYLIRPYKPGEEKYVADAHKAAYSKEYRWGESFTGYATKIALDFAGRSKNDKEELWVAQADNRLVGCIMLCQTERPLTGQLRLFLVEKEYRRYGIGTALINVLLKKAKDVGYRELILWTASPLDVAIRQYEKIGFSFVEKVENNDWSLDGKRLYEIKMQMPIS